MEHTPEPLLRFPPRSLDQKGRCCGRKPIPYKRPPRSFCLRCDAQFGPDGRQQPNWAWSWFGEDFTPTYPKSEAVRFAEVALAKAEPHTTGPSLPAVDGRKGR